MDILRFLRGNYEHSSYNVFIFLHPKGKKIRIQASECYYPNNYIKIFGVNLSFLITAV